MKLFVSYAHEKGLGNSVMEFPIDGNIECFEDIELLQRKLIEKLGIENIIVLNFVRLPY